MSKYKNVVRRCFRVNIILKPNVEPDTLDRVVRVLYVYGTPKSAIEEAKEILESNQQIGMIKEEHDYSVYE